MSSLPVDGLLFVARHGAGEPGLELPPRGPRSSYRTDDDIKCPLYLLMDSCSLHAMVPVNLASSSPFSASRSNYGTDDNIICRLYLLMDSCSLRAMAPVSLASSSPLVAPGPATGLTTI
jgi:hypothetical protein